MNESHEIMISLARAEENIKNLTIQVGVIFKEIEKLPKLFQELIDQNNKFVIQPLVEDNKKLHKVYHDLAEEVTKVKFSDSNFNTKIITAVSVALFFIPAIAWIVQTFILK